MLAGVVLLLIPILLSGMWLGWNWLAVLVYTPASGIPQEGLKFVEEPKVLRFFFGKLQPLENWGAELAHVFEADFGPDY